MRKLAMTVLALLALGQGACTGDRPKELYETARFEELQNTPGHAKELYEEILHQYPGSEFAKKAEERLRELPKGK